MIKNYISTGLRNFTNNKIYSFVNVLGLTVGLSACLLIATVVIDDLSYDRQWSRSKDLYRINSDYKLGAGLYDRSSSSFAGLKDELKKDFPEVEAASDIYTGLLQLKLNPSEMREVSLNSLTADTSIWSMLDIKVVSGNPRIYVDGQTNLLISESIRNKFFPGKNPLGTFVYEIPSYGDKPIPYLITGIIRDLPVNTHLRADVIQLKKRPVVPLSHQNEGYFKTQYLLMKPGTDIKRFSEMVNNWYNRFITNDNKYQFSFQPIRDIYLHSEFNQYQEVKGNMRNIYIFSGIAILVLFIACLNFINLSTSRAITRMQETGVRKILGAGRGQIIYQFMTESVIYFALSTFLAALIYLIALPFIARYVGHTLVKTFMSGIFLSLSAGGAILFVCLLTGIYPAWILSGYKPAIALRAKSFSGGSPGQTILRKSLVIIQFSISIVVLIAMIVVQQQVRFMRNTDVGYNKKSLLRISGISWDGKGDVIKNEIMTIPGVEQCTITSFNPSQGGGFMSSEIEDVDHPGQKIKIWYILGDINFAQTLGLRLQSGRLLNKDLGTDVLNDDSLEKNIILQPSMITASTARMLHINTLNKAQKKIFTTPVGIVEDFHNESLKQPLGPTFILADRSPSHGVMLVRVKVGSEKQVMSLLQKTWKKVYPSKPMDTNWVDDLLNGQYAAEFKLQQLFFLFSMLTMVLAALGIFGLVVHAAAQRIKEIGVRKVLGAKVLSIVKLLSADFIKLVFLAILIASPFAWWLMSKWLEDYAYRIHLSWWMFTLAGAVALMIALFTTSFQAVKSALANPVKSLRSE